ncbi:hypothetical protein F8M41_018083 [Gigaspora margarita]|uniref:Uncharacterized protein n=1 Tax=Gigaspora margarita TaxID=4874 RepID=A0A8H4ELH3_GIGMA|nr:hypothetical protein F8M41_018083 [Gigaspora margarita]
MSDPVEYEKEVNTLRGTLQIAEAITNGVISTINTENAIHQYHLRSMIPVKKVDRKSDEENTQLAEKGKVESNESPSSPSIQLSKQSTQFVPTDIKDNNMNDGGCTKNQETGNNNRIIQQQSLQHNVGSSSVSTNDIRDLPVTSKEFGDNSMKLDLQETGCNSYNQQQGLQHEIDPLNCTFENVFCVPNLTEEEAIFIDKLLIAEEIDDIPAVTEEKESFSAAYATIGKDGYFWVKYGEQSLEATARRRNKERDPNDRAQIGFKVDAVIEYQNLSWTPVIGCLEVSGGLPRCPRSKEWDTTLKL